MSQRATLRLAQRHIKDVLSPILMMMLSNISCQANPLKPYFKNGILQKTHTVYEHSNKGQPVPVRTKNSVVNDQSFCHTLTNGLKK